VQYQLLKMGIDSARMTTDAGIDLVVYAPGNRSASTVQVKTNMSAKPEGGRARCRGAGISLISAQRSCLRSLHSTRIPLGSLSWRRPRGRPSNTPSGAFVSCTGVSRPPRLDRNRRAMRHRWSATSSKRESRSCSPSKQARSTHRHESRSTHRHESAMDEDALIAPTR
jgi:hypothetical protein